MFGSNTKLEWNGTIDTVVDPLCTNNPYNYQRNGTIPNWELLLFAFNAFERDSSKVNIYFTGNFGGVLALTESPADTGGPNGNGLDVGFIYVNDNGGTSGYGSNAAILKSRLTLEHELGHYLSNGIWMNHTFGTAPNQRTYDAVDHLQVNGYLMTAGGVVTGNTRTLNIPGSQVNVLGFGGADELGLVSRRIYLGQWNNP